MRIALICKYPPIEGGESTKAYWLAKGLGERGHHVHVITNAWEVEPEYREKFEVKDLEKYQPKNVIVWNTDPFINPHYIPYTIPYTEKIASLAIDVINEFDLQLIDSWYILPYGISAFIAKIFTNRPQILRHAGSDLSRLINSPYLNSLFMELFKKVDKIITYPGLKKRFIDFGILEEKLFLNKLSIDFNAFNPKIKPFDLTNYQVENIDLPIITYIGKVGVTKGIYELINALSKINEDFIFLFVGNGRDFQKIKYEINNKKMKEKTIFLGFVPPWKIPSIMKLSTCIVIPERDFPIKAHTPILPREAMSVGVCTILSEEVYHKREYKEIEDGIHAIITNPRNLDNFREKLKNVINNPDYAKEIGLNARKLAESYEDFELYLNTIEKLYEKLITT